MKSSVLKTALMALVAVATLTGTVSAQEKSGIVAVLDVAKVFKQNRAFESRMQSIKSTADQLKAEIQQKQEAIKQEALGLKDFEVGRYQGTRRAASYASDVQVVEKDKSVNGPYHISMNEPLYYKNFTFYQSSFQEDEMGRPTTSIFSVNRDPGRWIKYLGSLMIVWGSILLFWRKRKRRPKKKA